MLKNALNLSSRVVFVTMLVAIFDVNSTIFFTSGGSSPSGNGGRGASIVYSCLDVAASPVVELLTASST